MHSSIYVYPYSKVEITAQTNLHRHNDTLHIYICIDVYICQYIYIYTWNDIYASTDQVDHVPDGPTGRTPHEVWHIRRLVEKGIEWAAAFASGGDTMELLVTKVVSGLLDPPVVGASQLMNYDALAAAAKNVADDVKDQLSLDAAKAAWDEKLAPCKALVVAINGYKALALRQKGVIERKEEAAKKKAEAVPKKAPGKTNKVEPIACQNPVFSASAAFQSIETYSLAEATGKSGGAKPLLDPAYPYVITDAVGDGKISVGQITQQASDGLKLGLLLFRAKAPSTPGWMTLGSHAEEILDKGIDLRAQMLTLAPANRVDEDPYLKKVFWTVRCWTQIHRN